MRILSLSLDPHILDSESVAASRAKMYGTVVDMYTVAVPSPGVLKTTISDKVSIHGSGGVNKVVRLMRLFFLIKKLHKQHQYDVISSQDAYFLGLLSYLFAKRYGLGLEVQVLGIEKLTPLRKKLARFILKQAGSIRVLSIILWKRLLTEFDAPEDRMLLVPIYVDVTKLGLDIRTLSPQKNREFTALQEDFKKNYGQCFNFLTVSRLVPIKNISLQLQAIQELKAEHPNVRLHIVGDGPIVKDLEIEVRNRGLENHVILHGSRYGLELGVFFLSADCFLLTSNYEGWGMVIIEAATAGLPVIMTDVGCAGEIIVNGESGMVIPVNDVSALQTAMHTMLQNTLLRDTYSSGALHALAKLPTLETILSLYKASWEKAALKKL